MSLDRKSRMADLKATLRILQKSECYVGIPAEKANREDGGPNNAVLGYLFEYGEPAQNMPPRPWLHPGVASVEKQIGDRLTAGAAKAFATIGEPSSATRGKAVASQTMHAVGLLATSAVRNRIVAGIAPPLSERTVYARLHRRKNRRTEGRMTPLLDTGVFLKAITYTVKV